jgi:hypothetical protein
MENKGGALPADRAVGGILLVVALVLLVWTLLICAGQVLGWLLHAQWQPIPAWYVMLTPGDLSGMAVYSKMNPLALVPGLGSSRDIEFSAKGIEAIVRWLLDLPLTFYGFVASVAAFTGSSATEA